MGHSELIIIIVYPVTGLQETLKGGFVQEEFENLLTEWIVACDQPFDEVDKQPFCKLLQYVHRPSTKSLRIPHRTAVWTRIMKMGEDTVDSVKKMFLVGYYIYSLLIPW